MASFLAKVASPFLRKFLNLNPNGGKSFEELAKLINKDTKKMKRGFVWSEHFLDNGTRYEVIKPKNGGNGKLVLYFHGGGYAAGLSQLYRTLACNLAKAAGGAECILLDYILSPKALYPSQQNEAIAIWKYVTEDLGYSPANVIVGGDSAGGNLTLSTLLRLRDEGQTLPCGVIAISPWADMIASGKSYEYNYNKDPMFGEKVGALTPEKREQMMKSDLYTWCGDADRKDPYVSPVFGDYKGFPSTIITAGEDELLLDDSVTIADNMKKNGVDVKLVTHERMFHIYPLYTMFPEGKAAFKEIIAFVSDKASKMDTSLNVQK